MNIISIESKLKAAAAVLLGSEVKKTGAAGYDDPVDTTKGTLHRSRANLEGALREGLYFIARMRVTDVKGSHNTDRIGDAGYTRISSGGFKWPWQR